MTPVSSDLELIRSEHFRFSSRNLFPTPRAAAWKANSPLLSTFRLCWPSRTFWPLLSQTLVSQVHYHSGGGVPEFPLSPLCLSGIGDLPLLYMMCVWRGCGGTVQKDPVGGAASPPHGWRHVLDLSFVVCWGQSDTFAAFGCLVGRDRILYVFSIPS